jgi:hypothetical protein
MTTFMEKLRNRRAAVRRSRAFEAALRQAPSEAMRRELLDMAARIR